ncbi:MAG: hypothetical protein CL570_03175 [Alphaproteobacteria bacterium]|nr:hypothetical protein [Alphaproteobacteria bacterium]
MGGISSGPRTTPVTYVVQQPTVSQTSESTDSAAESASDETTASEVRSDDLLRRQRGRGGTVGGADFTPNARWVGCRSSYSAGEC